MQPSRLSSVSPGVELPQAACCALHKPGAGGQLWSPNVAAPFIDRSSKMWNFRLDGFPYPLSPAP
jgi:hypothetical protein